MLKNINTKNYILAEITKNNTVKADVQGESIDNLSNLLVSVLKSYKELGLNKEDLLGLVDISYDETSNL